MSLPDYYSPRCLLAGMIAMLLAAQPADAQPDFTAQREPTAVHMGGYYQFYQSDNGDVSQFSIPLTVYAPVTRDLSATFRMSRASVSGDELALLSGFSDMHLSVLHSRRITLGTLVAGMNVNVPSGRSRLSPEEFETSMIANRAFYDFRTPGFGQGLNFGPSLSWAVPVDRNVALGLGVSLQYRGSFEPEAETNGSFDPGNEILLTAGIDYRAGAAAAISGDATVTLYGRDTFAGEEIFEPGTNLSLVVRYRQFFDFNELVLTGVYRNRGRGNFPGALQGTDPDEGIVPDHAQLAFHYARRLSRTSSLDFVGTARFYQRTELFPDERLLISAGIAPTLELLTGTHLTIRAMYGLGSVSGGELGFGISSSL